MYGSSHQSSVITAWWVGRNLELWVLTVRLGPPRYRVHACVRRSTVPIRSESIHPATSIVCKYHRGYDPMPMDNGGAHRGGVMETRNAAGEIMSYYS